MPKVKLVERSRVGVSLTVDVQARRSELTQSRRNRRSGRAVASVWVYALASGFVALGLTEVIAALTDPGEMRSSLQWATIPVVAVVAGLACESTLTRVRLLIPSRRH